MASAFDAAALGEIAARIREFISVQVFSWSMPIQLAVIVGAFWLARRVTRGLRAWCERVAKECPEGSSIGDDLARIIDFLRVVTPFLTFLIIWIAFGVAEHFHWPREALYSAGVFCIALTLVRLLTGQLQDRFWSGVLQTVIWLSATLYIFKLTKPWQAVLEHVNFAVGQFHISLLTVHRAVLLSLLLYWLARKLLIIWHCWLTLGSDLSPAVKILLYKLASILVYVAAVALVLHYMGLDLTVFTLFSGAVGLGLGFGLQKIFANLVSGFIILADKSIKPGDVIQMGERYGWINFLGSRYVSVVSRNGTEHLIPNENLITNEVINWSYSNNLVRLNVPVGVSYESDLEKARDLMLEVANATKRVLVDPKPSCLLSGFGDSAINLELRVWINDPQNGLGKVKSDLHWGIWKAFKEHGIELPYPQREVHLKTGPGVKGEESSGETEP
jgi:small-conductance mechanosensitive channel